MSPDITRESAASIADALSRKEISAVEVTQAHLDRIAAVDGDVHAFLHVDTDGALSAARDVDQRRAAGEELHALAGVPIAVKDVVATRGLPTTVGSRILEGWIPPYDATIVTRLRAAGWRSSARPTWTSSRWAPRPSTRPSARPTTRGTSTDPRRLRRRLGRRGGGVRGAARHRHRHRRLDPPAGRRHRHRRRQADLRRGLPLRPDRARQQPGPGRPGHPHRARRRAAARGHRRARPDGLHQHRRAGPAGRRGRAPRRRQGPADRRHQGARRRGLPGGRADPVRRVGAAAGRRRRRGRRGLLPAASTTRWRPTT